jgi:D-xylose transport system permease protein
VIVLRKPTGMDTSDTEQASGLQVGGHVRYRRVRAQGPGKARNFFSALQLDTRLLGMIGAFIVVVPGVQFDVTDGRFLTPRNIFNLSIQTVSVAIMATGMVFVIVTRNIDLSVGSLLATCSAMMAMTQTLVTPEWLGLGS